MEITAKTLLHWLMKGIVLIVAMSLIFGLGGFLYAKYFSIPTYSTSIKFYAAGSQSANPLQGNDYAKEVAPQYVEFLNVTEFYETVSQKLLEETGRAVAPADVEAAVTFSTIVTDTSTFYVYVNTTDPDLTYQIASAFAFAAPARVESFENVGTLQVISNPTFPFSANGAGTLRNAVLFAVIGFVLAAALVVIRELTDNRIRNAEEITELFGLPVFGEVPEFGEPGKKKGGR